MILVSLTIHYDGIEKIYRFKQNFNLVYSKKNSVGKSTLLRSIFYALGYSIPGTKNFNLHKGKFIISFIKNNKKMEIGRDDKFVVLKIDDQESHEFILPGDELELHSLVWETTNVNLLKNIIGSIFIDQEKGWTLLNRGTVIGKIPFNIEKLILGLSNRDVSELENKLEAIKLELKKYTQLQNILDYREHLAVSANNLFSPDYNSELDNQIQMLKFEKHDLVSQLKSLDETRKDNTRFSKYIENMKLTIKDIETGRLIPVTKETLVHFNDNQNYIETRYSMLKLQLHSLNEKIKKLEHQQNEMQNLIEVQSEIEKFDNQVANMNFDPQQIRRIIKKLEREKNDLNNSIRNLAVINNQIVTNLHKTIMTFAKKLNIDTLMSTKSDYIFTSDLKSLSGALLHKIVFSFKMAYITEIEKYLGIKLPIILDSPSGRELDQENIKDTMKIIKDYFSENQVIIASIYTYDELKPFNLIEIKHNLLEED